MKRHTTSSITSLKQLEVLLLEGLTSGEPEEVTDEYLRAREQEVAEIIARKRKSPQGTKMMVCNYTIKL